MKSYRIEAQADSLRADVLLAEKLDGVSRSAAQRLIEDGAVTVNGRPIRKNYKTAASDILEVVMPEPTETDIIPQCIALDVVYEDEDVIVVNKPRGMVVHPAPGHPDGTLVNALLAHCGASLSGIGGELRPGIVHRIDKDTSGLIISAKNDAAHQSLAAQLKDRSLSRTYEAVVRGRLEGSGVIDAPIGRHPADRKKMAVTARGSRNAVTRYECIEVLKGYTHLRCMLETGRTHQIRVHMAHIGHPVLGDMVYGAKKPELGLEGQCLHAVSIKFIHPTKLIPISLSCELPEYFKEILNKLRIAI